MIGRRLTATVDEIPADYYGKLEPGDYLWLPRTRTWYVKCPNGDEGSLRERRFWPDGGSGHTVEEHANGTITVTPSIQCETGNRWHGYLEKGVWRVA